MGEWEVLALESFSASLAKGEALFVAVVWHSSDVFTNKTLLSTARKKAEATVLLLELVSLIWA